MAAGGSQSGCDKLMSAVNIPDVKSKHDLIAELQRQTSALGLNVHEDAETGIEQRSGIRFGEVVAGRPQGRLPHVMPADGGRITRIHFREAVVERSWGIPPPTVTVETSSVSGWKRSGDA